MTDPRWDEIEFVVKDGYRPEAFAAYKSLRADVERMREALVLIRDIAYDRDGYHGADDLGELVDELYGYARAALAAKEE